MPVRYPRSNGDHRNGHLQVLQLKYTVVIAGARFPDKSQALQDLKQQHPERLHLLCLDVASDASIQVSKHISSDLDSVMSGCFGCHVYAICNVWSIYRPPPSKLPETLQ